MTTEPNISIESSGTEFSLKKKKARGGWKVGRRNVFCPENNTKAIKYFRITMRFRKQI